MVVPIAALNQRPRNLSIDAAGTSGLTFVTAWTALVSRAVIGPDDNASILGAAGGVGSAAVQIARHFGATVLAAVRNQQQAERAIQLGASQTVDTSTGSLIDEVRRQKSGRGADVVFDTTGNLFSESIEAAALGGRLCVIAAPADGMVNFNLRSVYRKELRVMGTDSRRLDVTVCSKLLAEMIPAIKNGKLWPESPASIPLEQAREAYMQVPQGKGRICLVPNV